MRHDIELARKNNLQPTFSDGLELSLDEYGRAKKALYDAYRHGTLHEGEYYSLLKRLEAKFHEFINQMM